MAISIDKKDLFDHAIEVLQNERYYCTDGSNLMWTSYQFASELRAEIDIGLLPGDISEVSESFFLKMADSASAAGKDDRNSIQIALCRDSAAQPLVERLLNILRHAHNSNFDIGRATEEEQVVLDYKVHKSQYDFYKVNWKSRFSNTVFPPPQVHE